VSTPIPDPGAAIRGLRRGACTIGYLLAVPAVAEWFLDPQQFYRSYLVAFLFILAPALGALAWILLHWLTGGRWGDTLSDVLAAAAGTLPFVALFFLPVLFGLREIYPWAAADWNRDGAAPLHQSLFLQRPFFIARAAVYLLVWAGLSRIVRARSSPGSLVSRRRVALGAVGLIACFLTITLASVDWGMSLSPGWYSSIYGLLWILDQALAALSLAILVRLFLARVLQSEVAKETLQDLGSLLFAAVLTWVYLAFSQLLIIWSANLPEEVTWYVDRLGPAWRGIGLIVLLAHFFLPFLLLLMRKVKRRAAYLAAVCAIVLAARLPDELWMIVPAFRAHGIPVHWLDLVLPASLFAIWCWLFLVKLEQRPASLEGAARSGNLEAA